MNLYENVAILDASQSDEALALAVQNLSDQFVKQGAEVLKTDIWGRRRMAYEINHHSKGYYVLFLLRGPSTMVSAMENYYKVTDGFVKYMFVRLEKKQSEAAIKSLVKTEDSASAPSEIPAEPEPAQPVIADSSEE